MEKLDELDLEQERVSTLSKDKGVNKQDVCNSKYGNQNMADNDLTRLQAEEFLSQQAIEDAKNFEIQNDFYDAYSPKTTELNK
jgi:hypothetical protein